MINNVRTDIVNLNICVVDNEWNLTSVINSSCELYRYANRIPEIKINDNMISSILGTNILPFYDINKYHFNFYCDDLSILGNCESNPPQTITVEILAVPNMCIILSPGLWFGIMPDRHRLCDDSALYNIAGSVSGNAIVNNTLFYKEFFDILNSSNSMNTKNNVDTDDTVVLTNESQVDTIETPIITD